MGGRPMDKGAVLLHLALVLAVLGGVLLVMRQSAPALAAFSLAAALFALGRRTPPPSVEPSTDTDRPPLVQDLPLGTRGESGTKSGTRAGEMSGPGATDDPASVEDVLRMPPPPAGRPVAPWAPSTRRVAVRSQPRHAAALDRVRRRAPHVRAVLASDLTSPHHPFAVAVFVDDEHVGDLDGDALLDYGEALAALAVRGIDISAEAFFMSHALDIALPDPAGLVPVNDIPRGVLLPHGAPISVVASPQEDRAGSVLGRYARAGHDVWLAVTLAAVRPPRRRDPVREVDVLVDGVVVGRVHPDEVDDVAPLLAFYKDRDLIPVAAAVLRGSSLHSRLTLSCIRAQDADETWLRSLGR